MRVPKNLVFLGFLYELVWRSKGGAQRITLVKLQTSLTVRARNVHGLFSNSSATAIFMLPIRNIHMTEASGQPKGYRLFERWNDYSVDMLFKISVPDSAVSLKRVGDLEKIEYTSDKLERAGDRKGDFSLYTHRYKTPLHLHADRAKDPRVFGAKLNSKRIVTSRGLVG